MYRRDVLRQSARHEYELARDEQDPELVRQPTLGLDASYLVSSSLPAFVIVQVSRMIVSGRDAVHQVVDKVRVSAPELVLNDFLSSAQCGLS